MLRCAIAAGRAAQTQVDTAWIQRFQGAELFRNDQRGMVGQHDAARTAPQRAGVAGHVADQHRRRAGRHAVDVVVFSQPEALVAQALHMLSHGHGVAEGVGRVTAMHNRGQVQDRKGDARKGAHADISGRRAEQGGNAVAKRARRKVNSIYRDTWGVYRRIQPGAAATLWPGGLYCQGLSPPLVEGRPHAAHALRACCPPRCAGVTHKKAAAAGRRAAFWAGGPGTAYSGKNA
ncbi:hypothetical protein G6F23_013020 [Rhizopus arrhizus]|nr:hypothetical protein G6F23_013020 [Rhizopus arrhizus]